MSRSLNRLTTGGFFFTIWVVYNKSTDFFSIILPFLKHAFSKTLRFFSSSMEPFFLSHDLYGDVFASDPLSPSPTSSSPAPDPLFLVPFRWWNEVREALYSVGEEEVVDGVLYNVASSLTKGEDLWEDEDVETEIVVEMMREGETERREEGVSGGGGSSDLALLSEWMFLRSLKWHDDMENVELFIADRDSRPDLFSLQIRIFCVQRTNSLVLRISQKGNDDRAFNSACSIFGRDSGLMRVWDFSGQTNQFLMKDQKLSNKLGQPDEETLLELQVYGLSSCKVPRENGNDEMILQNSKMEVPSSSSPLVINGNAERMDLFSQLKQPLPTGGGYKDSCILGLTGLFNLGNTCFMNSALQCLTHTMKLVDYFLGNFRKDLNFDNPLGMNGKLAIAFGDLLRKLWFPGSPPVAPRAFKSAIAGFAPQFSGYNQHDSQEFLAFLLDGLHEDLNRIKCKPYIETKDGDGRPDEEVADEHWRNHLARNSSVIVDLCQGQYRSTLVCPVCQKKSVTFDPFMYLSLPLPSTARRTMTLTVFSGDGATLPSPIRVTVPNNGCFKDLIQALSTVCALSDEETLLVAEIYNSRILRFLDNPTDSIELIRDDDRLVAYRMPKDNDTSPLVVFSHLYEKPLSSGQYFGVPFVTTVSDISRGSKIREMFLKLLTPFLMPVGESSGNHDAPESTPMEDAENKDANFADESENTSYVDNGFQFYLDNDSLFPRGTPIQMDEGVSIPNGSRTVQVNVYWNEMMIEIYDTSLLSYLPEVSKLTLMSKRALESISLDKCLDAFLKEEPLGPEDMWYCPNCKRHRQASKKLDLWRLPEILVIHLKRFSYSRYLKNKLDMFVDFPIDDFDLTSYLIHNSNKVLDRYSLYAISNHYGGMGGGHYTAFAQHKHNKWYEFDDEDVREVEEERIKTSAAYVLFYRRISDINIVH